MYGRLISSVQLVSSKYNPLDVKRGASPTPWSRHGLCPKDQVEAPPHGQESLVIDSPPALAINVPGRRQQRRLSSRWWVANRLSQRHSDFQQQKMKVNLAVQITSTLFCREGSSVYVADGFGSVCCMWIQHRIHTRMHCAISYFHCPPVQTGRQWVQGIGYQAWLFPSKTWCSAWISPKLFALLCFSHAQGTGCSDILWRRPRTPTSTWHGHKDLLSVSEDEYHSLVRL